MWTDCRFNCRTIINWQCRPNLFNSGTPIRRLVFLITIRFVWLIIVFFFENSLISKRPIEGSGRIVSHVLRIYANLISGGETKNPNPDRKSRRFISDESFRAKFVSMTKSRMLNRLWYSLFSKHNRRSCKCSALHPVFRFFRSQLLFQWMDHRFASEMRSALFVQIFALLYRRGIFLVHSLRENI